MSDFFTQADAYLTESYPAAAPGAAVLVRHKGQTLLRKGYGMANLELNVAAAPEHVFRLGSITKQFTAIALLMLAEEGMLSVQDEITRFLPDYPTRGETITLEHLLTHTSGIPSYTDQPEWLAMWRQDLTPDKIAGLTQDKPLDFKPGTQFKYCNTGYILLGMVIEQISGMPYAQFVQQRLFDPLGMAHTLYDDPTRLVPGRAAGYTRAGDQFANAAFLSMTQPYAAGSLASNVDDMALWDTALQAGKLVRADTLAQAHTSFVLADGRPAGYGYGWGIAPYEDWTFLEHGGGINGFSTHGLSCPAEGLFVIVLTNLETPKPTPDLVALTLAGLALGKPVQAPKAIQLADEALVELTGVYKINETERRYVMLEDGKLFSQRTGGAKFPLVPIAPDWLYSVETGNRVHFTRGANGAVTGMALVTRFGPPEEAVKVDEPLPLPRAAIELEPAALPRYAGEYELAPGMSLVVRLEGGKLQVRFPGDPEWLDLFAENPTMLFIRQADLTLIADLPAGGAAVQILTIHQGGQVYVCKRK